MTPPILATKLYIPPPRSKVVLRPRLIERLNESLVASRKLTLISAPAGFGKTTLVSEWVAGCDRPVAWLSLDEEDNDPTRFLTYIVAALQIIDANMGAETLSLLQSPQPLPAEWILTSLINEVTETPENFILFLDDYHVIQNRAIHDALTFLLDRLPARMHLAIASRANPPLPLARLRGRGDLTELRASDLRFNPGEATTFLNQMMGLDLSVDDVAALETRTEGWIAGLQMAALSMQGRADTASFIQAFTGSHHFIIDYLVEEVLQRQPEHVRSFLLQTSILDRLSGPLCNAVTGQEDGQGMLEVLERGNLFIIPLDDRRQWYRYHHLFADVLLARLVEEQPDEVPVLHGRASDWYERNDLPSDAIHHALASRDFERAASLVELAASAMRRSRQDATLLSWLKALPDQLIRSRPVLSVGYAFALSMTGQLEAVEPRLRDAERWLDATVDPGERSNEPVTEMVVVNEEEFRSLPGMISVARAAQAQAFGDIPGTMKHAQRALDLMIEGDYLLRGAAAGLLALAYWANGDLEAAHQIFDNARASLTMAGNISDVIGGTLILADIRTAQGRLREAASTYEQSLQSVTKQGGPVLRGTADLYVGMSELYREWGDPEAATRHLLRSKEMGERAGLPENRYRWRVAMARIKEDQGDLYGALDLLNEAERLYMIGFFPNVRPVAALKARIRVVQGRLAEALGWAREQGLSANDTLSYLHEFEHITLAKVLIAQYTSNRADHTIHEAMGLLERLLKAAEEGERTGSIIEILVLQALASQAQGDIPLALASLERALTLAEPEGYVRIFVDEGEAMRILIADFRFSIEKQMSSSAHAQLGYTGKLLAAFAPPINQPSTIKNPKLEMLEPLSERELEVLRLLRTELNGPEIAGVLLVSLNTMRTHTKNIFRKLGVNNRRAAVRRAEELDLL